ncbi:hypothetical protein BCR44DRAFT_1445902 [Catenaria anguillulae PL171]|uniref:Uncharacterized protein n=1 Tax=Catenaria anguillulae PL171 TaxID=765915 RepID=A0A1Y2H6F8_9FUNG|nr:hypothetical protein BCR44DRAFT_1445902 [Catenaria anguillulae PL171]
MVQCNCRRQFKNRQRLSSRARETLATCEPNSTATNQPAYPRFTGNGFLPAPMMRSPHTTQPRPPTRLSPHTHDANSTTTSISTLQGQRFPSRTHDALAVQDPNSTANDQPACPPHHVLTPTCGEKSLTAHHQSRTCRQTRLHRYHLLSRWPPRKGYADALHGRVTQPDWLTRRPVRYG